VEFRCIPVLRWRRYEAVDKACGFNNEDKFDLFKYAKVGHTNYVLQG